MSEWIVPELIDINEVISDIDQGLQATMADPVETGYALFVVTWNSINHPKWDDTGPKTEGNNRVLIRETDSTPFIWVDQGTDGPYPIKAKNAPVLSFKVGGFPKTKPGQLLSTAGSPGTEWRNAKEVMHPGIKQRDATGEVVKRCDEVIDTRMQGAIDAGKTY